MLESVAVIESDSEQLSH